MLKVKDLHIRVTAEQLRLVREIAQKDKIKISQVLERAIENYFISKRILKE